MSVSEARREIFWMAFKGLPKKDRQSVVERFLKDNEFIEDLIDIVIFEQRRNEPSRPLKTYLADRSK
jgi:hypothetical protein